MKQYISPILDTFLAEFQSGSLPSTEDTELHKMLFSRIYGHFFTLGIRFKIPRKELAIGYYEERDLVEVNPVKTAYPTREKFDVAVMKTENPVTVEQVAASGDAESAPYTAFWKQQLALALYIRHCGEEQDLGKFLKQADKDGRVFDRFRSENGGQDALDTGISLVLTTGHTAIPEAYADRAKSLPFSLEKGSGIWVIDASGSWFLEFA